MSEINNNEEHTMKKRFLSLLMAFCLMLSLAPAAFAADNQPDTVTLPSGENVEIPNVSSIQFPDDGNLTAEVSASDVSVCSVDAESELGYEGSGTAADPYKVYSGKGLVNLSSKFQSSNMTFSRIYLMNDIDLSKETITNTYLFRYFAGVIQSSPELIQAGKRAVIKGMGIRSLVYGFFMGTLGYFDVDMGGVPSQLTLIPGTVSGQYLETSVQNVDIYSGSKEGAGKLPVSLENGDAQANYSPYVFATGGTFTMKNCTNYADITGTTYGSVFYGYYPLGEAPITFTNCVNKGTFTMRHAAMFFGNNTLFSGSDTYFAFHKDDPTQNKIQFGNYLC